MLATADLLDRLLGPVSQAMTLDTARHLLALRADPEIQAQIDDLADRCTEGQLTDEQRADYESLVSAGNLIAILQAKARAVLTNNPAA